MTLRHAGLIAVSLAALACGALCAPLHAADGPESDARIEALVSQMTLQEKVGQMCQFVGIEHLKGAAKERGKIRSNNDAVGLYPGVSITDLEAMVRRGEIGSFLHVVTAAEANRLQALAHESRLQVPLLIGIDAIHGDGLVRGATIYPSPISLAAGFDDALVEKIARETAIETRANGAQWAFSPNIDVARDARWGRVGETFGEDPLLVGRLGAALVRGLEGHDLPPGERVLSCIKHAIAGSQPVNGLNGAPTDISERTLRTVFLPPYLDAIAAGTGSLMTAHNELNGVPCHANRWLVEDLLRGDGHFQGFVVSDWLDIERLATVHHVAANQKEAVYQTVMAGMDMHMHGPGFFGPLVELVKEGRIPESRIDESARRILKAKAALGLFEQPLVQEATAAQVTFSAEHQATALAAAREAIVLLKNDHDVLPLGAERRRVLVTGPLADTPAVLGDWVLEQPEDHVITPLAGIRAAAPTGTEVDYFDCGHSAKQVEPAAIQRAAAEATKADVVVLVLGENPLRYDNADKTSGENVDRSDIELPGNQLDLVKSVVAAGKPVIVVLLNGRPIGSEWTVQHTAALVEAFEPGCKGGQALGEILFGQINPSGKLPITIPRTVGQIQAYANYLPSQYFHQYVIGSSEPLFWFGQGLSYTRYQYSNLRLPARIAPGETVRVTVDVANVGRRAGDETVLLYVRDLVSSTTTPVRALKAYRRVSLAPGEKKTVELQVAYQQLALLDSTQHWVVEPGRFRVMVADQAAEFDVVAP